MKKSLMVAGTASVGYFLIAFFVYYHGQKVFFDQVLIQTLLFFVTGTLCYYFLQKKFFG